MTQQSIKLDKSENIKKKHCDWGEMSSALSFEETMLAELANCKFKMTLEEAKSILDNSPTNLPPTFSNVLNQYFKKKFEEIEKKTLSDRDVFFAWMHANDICAEAYGCHHCGKKCTCAAKVKLPSDSAGVPPQKNYSCDIDWVWMKIWCHCRAPYQ